MTTFGEKFFLPSQMVEDLGLVKVDHYFQADNKNIFYIVYAVQDGDGYYVREVILHDD
jgi:hypothetical protein